MEFFDIVDKNDKVIGTAAKDEVFQKKLRHRIVHILIFNNEGKMALQLRGDACKFLPNHWSTSVGGHIQANESYEDAAKREFNEELGTQADLHFFSRDLFTGPDGMEMWLVTYKAEYEGPFKLERGKVDKVEFFSMDEIKQMIINKEKFHPELLFLLRKYFLN